MVWLNLLQNQLESCIIQVTWSIYVWKIPYKISKSGVINTGVLVITLLLILNAKLLIFDLICIKLLSSTAQEF